MTGLILKFAPSDDALKELDIVLWLRHAEALLAAGYPEDAAVAFENVAFRIRHRSNAQVERMERMRGLR